MKGRYFRPDLNYEFFRSSYCQECHNNRPFSEYYSQSYMDYMNLYENWIKKKFGKKLKRKPQPNDIIDNSPAFTH
jgi:hypothetical protein